MKISAKDRRAAAASSPLYVAVPGPGVQHHRKKLPRHVATQPDILLEHGQTLVQPNLPPLRLLPHAAPPPSPADRAAEERAQEFVQDPDITAPTYSPGPDPTKYRRKRADQWARWQTDTIPLVLPHLAQVLHVTRSLRLVHDLELPPPRPSDCTCIEFKTHSVVVVRFSKIEDVNLRVCRCAPLSVQLVQGGVFGCAPVAPSLAVDMRVLEFARNLFLHVAPNNTAFSATLEGVLAAMGFQLQHQASFSYCASQTNSLRRRFGNTLMWYTHAYNRLKDKYTRLIDVARETLHPEPLSAPPAPQPTPQRASQTPGGRTTESRGRSIEPRMRARSSSPSTPTPASLGRRRFRRARSESSSPGTPTPAPRGRQAARSSSPGTPAAPRAPRSSSPSRSRTPVRGRKRAREPTPEPVKVPFPEPPPRTRPSEHLRKCCPACFGDLKHNPAESCRADLMVCLDACFTQKKNKSRRDPPKYHPRSRFVPENIARKTEEYVESVRQQKKKTKRPKKNDGVVVNEEEDEDCYEHGLPLPRSVLDGCEASFKAADEKREKASTDFFEDSALMALLCRHDRVLFVINMHSAGEKQFNVVALMESLFQELPLNIRVGLLYDVACSFERSCRKWGFLSRFLDRLAFAVSVFHAFGHEWACQLLYHPRKRVGFGFTNGEGCERFWHSISHLIAHLRICAYHNRLYTLDAQMEHADEASLLRLGAWVSRRDKHSRSKRVEATKALAECGYSIATLRAQWRLQVTAQTKPLPKRSKTGGQQAVSNIILLRGSVKTQEQLVAELRAAFVAAVEAERPEAGALKMDVATAEAALKATKDKLRRKERDLGFAEKENLRKLLKSEYMRLVMNARALKLRLIQRLQHRKFEMDPVERACRRLLNDAKLHSHTEAAVKRREPTISKTCAEYNKICAQLQKLIRDHQAPRNAIAPLPIPSKGLWKLDVDDVIFQNVGLDERIDGEAGNDPPLWLSDEHVRTGIKAMLDLDRCNEEDARLRRERRALQVWFAEEWEVVSRAIQDANSSEDTYHLNLRQNKLVRLCATWRKDLPDLGLDTSTVPAWGPSAEQLAMCMLDAHEAARGDDRHYGTGWGDEGDEDDAEAEGGGEEEHFGTLEALERADVYRNDD
ncbi:hypothetical protein C8F04DRAFT_968373 [Mycena alexandri]|uniref:CxC1-like cysteine cluster associated with KDZ transposases domain-containing protein n=1 Tax=Mycena alexandri TaxID=1745969 RepID=A0AAD6SBW7_9AGAR|nr:hypothetical protein C8F04DRAFT_968373 [Mycena alexandri]